jgi:hypothetical protein
MHHLRRKHGFYRQQTLTPKYAYGLEIGNTKKEQASFWKNPAAETLRLLSGMAARLITRGQATISL